MKTWGLAVRWSCAMVVGVMVALNPTARAQTAGLKPVPPALVPKSGTFYSLQKTNEPPRPFNPFPDLPVYALGPGRFLIDDRSVDYAALSAVAAGGASGGAQQSLSPESAYGCGLWLSIAASSNSAVRLTLHNTVAGHQYQVLTNRLLNKGLFLRPEPSDDSVLSIHA